MPVVRLSVQQEKIRRAVREAHAKKQGDIEASEGVKHKASSLNSNREGTGVTGNTTPSPERGAGSITDSMVQEDDEFIRGVMLPGCD